MPNELHDAIEQVSRRIQDEYGRIQRRATEDPGTAGDNGEENWKELLGNWLPASYPVVTKGRILNTHGECSPQVDVLVLSPAYPKAMIGTKEYLAGGVLAAFECKLTLTAKHVREAVETSAAIARLVSEEPGKTPYEELRNPVVYGLLSHSHSWRSENSSPMENVEKALHDEIDKVCHHPRELLDLICIADCATWSSQRLIVYGDRMLNQMRARYATNKDIWSQALAEHGLIETVYIRSSEDTQLPSPARPPFEPVGAAIVHVLRRLAWRDPMLRPLVQHLTKAQIGDSGSGYGTIWRLSSLRQDFLSLLPKRSLTTGRLWDEWSMIL